MPCMEGRGCQSPWSWSRRWLWAIPGCWDLNSCPLQEHLPCLITESSLQFLFFCILNMTVLCLPKCESFISSSLRGRKIIFSQMEEAALGDQLLLRPLVSHPCLSTFPFSFTGQDIWCGDSRASVGFCDGIWFDPSHCSFRIQARFLSGLYILTFLRPRITSLFSGHGFILLKQILFLLS